MSIQSMLNKTVKVQNKLRAGIVPPIMGGMRWTARLPVFNASMPCRIVPMTGDEIEWASQRGIVADSAMYFTTSGVNEDHLITDTGLTKEYDVRFVGLHRGGVLQLYRAYMEERDHPATT